MCVLGLVLWIRSASEERGREGEGIVQICFLMSTKWVAIYCDLFSLFWRIESGREALLDGKCIDVLLSIWIFAIFFFFFFFFFGLGLRL